MEVPQSRLLRPRRPQEDRGGVSPVLRAERERAEEVRTFGTTTRDLLRLADWLTAAGCTHIAMVQTGSTTRRITRGKA
jgi:hypothetical protein